MYDCRKWTLKHLKTEALNLWYSVNHTDCFSSDDNLRLLHLENELVRRGYELQVHCKPTIVRKDADEEEKSDDSDITTD